MDIHVLITIVGSIYNQAITNLAVNEKCSQLERLWLVAKMAVDQERHTAGRRWPGTVREENEEGTRLEIRVHRQNSSRD